MGCGDHRYPEASRKARATTLENTVKVEVRERCHRCRAQSDNAAEIRKSTELTIKAYLFTYHVLCGGVGIRVVEAMYCVGEVNVREGNSGSRNVSSGILTSGSNKRPPLSNFIASPLLCNHCEANEGSILIPNWASIRRISSCGTAVVELCPDVVEKGCCGCHCIVLLM